MLSLLKRKPKPLANTGDKAREPLPRKRQQNIKVTKDCAVTFAALAEAQDMSKAALFEDSVAERLETVQRQGLELGISKL